MTELNFDFIQLKTAIKLDFPLNMTFSEISEPILKQFNLDISNFPDSKIKYIYKQIMVKNNQTLESYHVEPQSKIVVYFPKEIKETILKQKKENTSINQTLLSKIDHKLLNDLEELQFPRMEAIYALAYSPDIENAVELISLGIPANPDYRFHIDEIYNQENIKLFHNKIFDNLVRHDVELSKIIGNAQEEDVDVRVGALISQYLEIVNIQDQKYLNELTEFVKKVQEEKPGQIKAFIDKYEKERRHFLISLPIEFFKKIENDDAIFQPIIDAKNEFFALFHQFPTMNPNNFVNPFSAVYDKLLKLQPDQQTLDVFKYGKTLNYIQLKFVHHYLINHQKSISTITDALKKGNGDVNEAKAIINGDILNNPIQENESEDKNALLIPRPSTQLAPVDENVSIANIMKFIDQNIFQELLSYGFDKNDVMYAIIYDPDMNNAIEFIDLGIASNQSYRYHINQIFNGQCTIENLVRNDIELSRIIANAKGENEQIRVSANIKFYLRLGNLFCDTSYLKNLMEFLRKSEQLYKNEIDEMTVRYLSSGSKPCINFPLRYLSAEANSIQEITQRFNKIFQQIPTMTPENFVNPFKYVFDDLMKMDHDIQTENIFKYGKDMNYEQVKFVYVKVLVEHRDLNEIIEYLILSNGDIKSAQSFINQSS